MTAEGLRATLIACTASGRGVATRVAGTVAARLRTAVARLDQVVPDTADHMTLAMRRAVDKGEDVLVVLGGDGAAHAAAQACAETGTALAVLPGGTGNDLARALGMPADPVAATNTVVRSLRDGTRRRIDVGRLADGPCFTTVLCAGFDSAVSERVNRMRWPRGRRRYDLAILAELGTLRARPLVVTTANRRWELDATLVAVGNTAWYGGGVPICPTADATDGLLDVTVVGQVGRADLLRILPKLRTGGHVDHPAVTTVRAAAVSLAGNDAWISYADGERMRPLPVDIRCAPGALSVVTSREYPDGGQV